MTNLAEIQIADSTPDPDRQRVARRHSAAEGLVEASLVVVLDQGLMKKYPLKNSSPDSLVVDLAEWVGVALV